MDLKGRHPVEIQQSGERLRVWYEEEASTGVPLSRVCYTGHVTSYVPGRGLRVWFDGFSANEQEWVDGNDEWEWEDSNCVSRGGLDGNAACGDVNTATSMAVGGEYLAVRIKLRQADGKPLSVQLPAPPPGRAAADVAPERAASPRRFNKKARLLSALAAEGVSSEVASAAVGGVNTPSVDSRADGAKEGKPLATVQDDSSHAAPPITDVDGGNGSASLSGVGGRAQKRGRGQGSSAAAPLVTGSSRRGKIAGSASAGSALAVVSRRLRVHRNGIVLLVPTVGAEKV